MALAKKKVAAKHSTGKSTVKKKPVRKAVTVKQKMQVVAEWQGPTVFQHSIQGLENGVRPSLSFEYNRAKLLASKVAEHGDDPLEFLEAIRGAFQEHYQARMALLRDLLGASQENQEVISRQLDMLSRHSAGVEAGAVIKSSALQGNFHNEKR